MEYLITFIVGFAVGYIAGKPPVQALPKDEEIDASPSFFYKVKQKQKLKPKVNSDEKAYVNERDKT